MPGVFSVCQGGWQYSLNIIKKGDFKSPFRNL